MPRVDIPGIGLVDFPDTMSDEEISNTIKTKILKPEGPKVVAEDAADFTRGIANIVPQWQNVSSSAKTLTGVVAKKMGFNETGAEMIIRKCIEIDVQNPDAAPGVEIAKYFGIQDE